MIYCLTGKIIKKSLDSVVISCAGVGYFVQIPATTGEAMPPAGQEGTVYTIMNVTENDVSLYGFATEEQRDCFKMLTGVTVQILQYLTHKIPDLFLRENRRRIFRHIRNRNPFHSHCATRSENAQ